MKNKLGFVVGHPTQFEGPMYQYFTKEHKSFLNVYFYEGAKTSFIDKELSRDDKQSWGIDILNGYSYKVLSKWNAKGIIDIFKNNKYIIINGYSNVTTIILIFLGKLKNRKIGLRLDTVKWNNNTLFKKLIKLLLIKILNNLIDIFWVVGSKSKEYLISNGVSPYKIKFLSYVVDNEWFKNNSNLSSIEKIKLKEFYKIPIDKKIVLCVSKLVERELPIDVIDALKILNNTDIYLMIVGDGDKRNYLEEYANSILPIENINFIGYVKYFQLPSIYSICDLFIHPSKNEPWGVSVQEALACGKPVISSSFVGAGYDLIKDGKNGFIYLYNDIEDLANKIDASLKFSPEQIDSENSEILKYWNYKTAFNLINEHIESL